MKTKALINPDMIVAFREQLVRIERTKSQAKLRSIPVGFAFNAFGRKAVKIKDDKAEKKSYVAISPDMIKTRSWTWLKMDWNLTVGEKLDLAILEGIAKGGRK